MSSNHFNYFRVKNFKRFKDLEVKDIGQFNLVLGDNNVGKTSLLEGLTTAVEDDFNRHVGYLIMLFKMKGLGETVVANFWKYFSNNESSNESEYIQFQYEGRKESYIRQLGRISNVQTLEDTKDLFYLSTRKYDESWNQENSVKHTLGPLLDFNAKTSIPFVPFASGLDSIILQTYREVVQYDKILRVKLLESVIRMFPEIEEFEMSINKYNQASIVVFTRDSPRGIDLAYFGEGLIKVFNHLLYILEYRNKCLSIDEIDAGIHYSRMKDYWKVILQSAMENDVQLFATTHNRECMEAYKMALEELGEEFVDKARTITLKESKKTGDSKAYTAGFGVLKSAVELGNELR